MDTFERDARVSEARNALLTSATELLADMLARRYKAEATEPKLLAAVDAAAKVLTDALAAPVTCPRCGQPESHEEVQHRSHVAPVHGCRLCASPT
jgi:hypothetical protein